jgi:hypothetical protein
LSSLAFCNAGEQVKKKKRATKVGMGREEEEEAAPERRASATTSAIHEESEGIEEPKPAAVSAHSSLPVNHETTFHAVADHYAGNGNQENQVHHHQEEVGNHEAEPSSSFSFMSPDKPTTPPPPVPVHLPVEEEKPVMAPTSSLFDNMDMVTQKEPVVPAVVLPTSTTVASTQPTSNNGTKTTPQVNSILQQFDKVKEPTISPKNKNKTPVHVEEMNFHVPDSLASELVSADYQIINGFHKLRLNYLESYHLQQSLLNSLDNISTESTQLIEKISSLESKQEVLAANEDFEQAELISDEIELLQKDLQNKNDSKSAVLVKLKELRKDYNQEKTNAINQLFSSLNLLFISCDDTRSHIDIFANKLKEFESEEQSKLIVEKQRVDMEKSHCEREQEALNKENQVIEDAIKSQVGDFYTKKEAIENQLSSLQEEIRELENQLKMKKAYETDLLKSLSSIDSKINEARKKFDRQLSRIQERLDTLSKAQRECLQEEKIIQCNELKYNNIFTKSTKIINEANDLIDNKTHERIIINAVIEDLKSFTKKYSTEEHKNNLVLPTLGLESSWEAYEILQQSNPDNLANDNVRMKMESMQQMKTSLAKLHGTLSEERIIYETKFNKQKSLTEQIESLELTKKLHATNKRFKEAGATAKEIKEQSELKEKIEGDITVHLSTITDLEEKEKSFEEQISVLETELLNEQKLEKQYHLENLSMRIFDCRKLLRRFKKAYKEIYSSRTTTGEEFVGILGEIIHLYESEEKLLINLREELCQKNGFDIPEDEPLPEEEEEKPQENIEDNGDLTTEENGEEITTPTVKSFDPSVAPDESDAVIVDMTTSEPEIIEDNGDLENEREMNSQEENQPQLEEEEIKEPEPEPEPVPQIDVEVRYAFLIVSILF